LFGLTAKTPGALELREHGDIILDDRGFCGVNGFKSRLESDPRLCWPRSRTIVWFKCRGQIAGHSTDRL